MNHSQVGEASPNPDFPQDVNNVTGNNVIKISNKNILNLKNNTYSSNGLTAVVNNQEITISGTSTNASTMDLQLEDDIVLSGNYSIYIKYTGTNTNVTSFQTLFRNASDTNIWIYQLQNYSYNVNELKNNASGTIHYIRLYIAPTGSVVNGTLQIMINKTSTLDSNYIAHKEDDYEIDFSSINLIDISNTTKYPSATTSGVTVTNNGDGSLTLDGTATAKVNYFITSNPKTYFESEFGAYTYKCFGLPATCNSNISYGGQPTGENIQTYNINTAGRNYSIRIEIPSGVTVTNVKIKPMLVKGTYTATTYPNYEANVYNIELCKISNYQDYIYKNNGKWYKHKAINKFIYNNEGSVSTPATNYYNINSITGLGGITTLETKTYLSNEYKAVKICQTDSLFRDETANDSFAFGFHSNGNTIRFKDTRGLTADEFKADLVGTEFYFALLTPIEEEITYEPLLRQLDKLDKIGLYDISNISQENTDMKMLLDFTICNDNYNGLREFIRS